MQNVNPSPTTTGCERTDRGLCWAGVLQREESAASGLNRGGHRQERPLLSSWHFVNEAFMRGLDTTL